MAVADWAIPGLIAGAIAGRMLFGPADEGVGGLGLLGGGIVILLALVRRRLSAPSASVGPRRRVDAWAAPAPADRQPDDAELDRGVRDVRRTDPGFDPLRFAGYAGMLFREAQRAWTTGDIGALRDRVTPEMHDELRAQYDRRRSTRRASRVERLEITAEITEVWQEGGRDYLTAHIGGSSVDTADAGGGGSGGAPATPRGIDEFWTFTRPAGLNFWMLSAIQGP